MQRNAVKVVVFLCALITLLNMQSTDIHAISVDNLSLTEDPLFAQARIDEIEEQKELKEKEKEKLRKKKEAKRQESKKTETEKPESIEYVVQSGDSLAKIGDHFDVSWKRLFDRNIQIENPDIISAGQTIIIPDANEDVTERELPAVELPAAPARANATGNNVASGGSVQISHAAPANSAGNTYAPGYCTWYAKSRRPDLPNRMGDAISWVSSAASQGYATGSTPRAGAIGQSGNHVVYVESVNGDGTVTVSEMNYQGLYIVSSRTVAASSFTYIY